jgi:hypothetical protein
MSEYRLDYRANNVRSPAEARLPIQWVSGVLSPGVKRGQDVALTTYPIYCRSQE